MDPTTDAPGGGPPGDGPTAVAFDIGEVLIDETRVWTVWASLLGLSPATVMAVLGAAIVDGEDHAAALSYLAPNVDWRDLEEDHEARYGGFGPQDLYADASRCLAEVHGLGLRVVVAGNQPRRRAAQLATLGLSYDALATSGELGVEKPDPAFFEAVVRLAGVEDPARVLYVGDRVDNDIIPAAAAGMRTCWVRRGPWGRLHDLPDDFGADLVLEGLGELPTLLSAWTDPGRGEAADHPEIDGDQRREGGGA